MVNTEVLKQLMEVAGYTYDGLESEPGNLRFLTETGTSTFECWAEVYRWLDGVVFDDPAVADLIGEGLKDAGDPIRMEIFLTCDDPGRYGVTVVRLPMDTQALKEQLGERPWNVADCSGVLRNVENVFRLNEILQEFETTPDEVFRIVESITVDLEGVMEKLEGGVMYINFTEWTKDWSFADIHDDADRGRVLYENGYMLPEALKKLDRSDYEKWGDLIRWECIWEEAESLGWQAVSIDGDDGEVCYLVDA